MNQFTRLATSIKDFDLWIIRDHCLLSLLSRHFVSGILKVPEICRELKFDSGYNHIVYIEGPTGPITFPVRDEYVHLFAHLKQYRDVGNFFVRDEELLSKRIHEAVTQIHARFANAVI